MTGVVIWTLFVAVVSGLLGFLACALLHTAAPYDDDRTAEFEATRRALQMAQREWN